MKSLFHSPALLLAVGLAMASPLPSLARDNRGGGGGAMISRGGGGGGRLIGSVSRGSIGGSRSFASRPANFSSRAVGGNYGRGGVSSIRSRPVASLNPSNRGLTNRSYGSGVYRTGLAASNRSSSPRLSYLNRQGIDFRSRNGGSRYSRDDRGDRWNRDGRDRNRGGDRSRYSRGRYYGGGYPFIYTSPYYYSSYPYFGSRYENGFGSSYGVYDYNDYLDTSYGDYDTDVTYDYQTSVIDVQRQLRREGYYTGPLDGDFGPGTRSAVRSYQRDHRLSVTGSIDVSLLRSLDLQ